MKSNLWCRFPRGRRGAGGNVSPSKPAGFALAILALAIALAAGCARREEPGLGIDATATFYLQPNPLGELRVTEAFSYLDETFQPIDYQGLRPAELIAHMEARGWRRTGSMDDRSDALLREVGIEVMHFSRPIPLHPNRSRPHAPRPKSAARRRASRCGRSQSGERSQELRPTHDSLRLSP